MADLYRWHDQYAPAIDHAMSFVTCADLLEREAEEAVIEGEKAEAMFLKMIVAALRERATTWHGRCCAPAASPPEPGPHPP